MRKQKTRVIFTLFLICFFVSAFGLSLIHMPVVSATNTTPNSALGDDYLMFWNYNGDPSAWSQSWVLSYIAQFHCSVARLGISFSDEPVKLSSTYDKTKLNTVLTILSNAGVKVILADFGGVCPWYGSAAWVNDWKQVATDFKGDSRIEGFEIANEPYSGYLSSTGPTGGVTDMHSFDVACNYLITQIRAIDPTRTIVYPIVDSIMTASASAFYNDLVSTGVTAQGNILYDIIHPYYFQNSNDLGFSPTQKAQWYWTTYCLPQISYFGVQNCWCGETFCFPRTEYIDDNPANGYYSYTLQQQFEVAMINYFVGAGMGFQNWVFFSSTDQQAQIDSITSSNYAGSSPLPTPTPTPSSTAIPTPNPTDYPINPNQPLSGFFVLTQAPFNINFGTGQSFAVQSLNPASTITFTVTSGTLNGTGSVNATNTGGIFQIIPTTSGTLLVTTTGAPVSVYIGNTYVNNIPYSFTPGDPTITWTYGTGQIIIGGGSNPIQYYFRSDTYTTLGVIGYGFDKDYTNTAQTINETYSGTNTLNYAFQAYLFSSPTNYQELTNGPSATITLNGNYTGQDSATVNMPQTPVTLGYQALQINVLEQYNNSGWVTVANYVSPVLITNSIEASTWTFTLYLNNIQQGGNTYTSFTFGDSQYRSGISGISLSTPLQSDIAMWRLSQGDYIGWLLGEYLDEIGIGFYGLILFGAGATLYFRYRHFGTVLFFFTIFGGPGGLAWILLPPWGAAVASALIILGASFIVWRVLR